MTREERIRTKLKFFKLEHESLETTQERIRKKLKETSTRFGPISSNMTIMKTESADNSTSGNPFLEMIALEAEFGPIIEADEDDT